MKDRILIVDDEKDIVAMLSSYFTLKGYEVLSAKSGLEAIEMSEKQPDVILLDINMRLFQDGGFRGKSGTSDRQPSVFYGAFRPVSVSDGVYLRGKEKGETAWNR